MFANVFFLVPKWFFLGPGISGTKKKPFGDQKKTICHHADGFILGPDGFIMVPNGFFLGPDGFVLVLDGCFLVPFGGGREERVAIGEVVAGGGEEAQEGRRETDDVRRREEGRVRG